MNEKILTGILLDPYAEIKEDRVYFTALGPLEARLQLKTIKHNLPTLYGMLHCRCVDITEKTIGGITYQIVIDDEGLLIDKPIITAVASDGKTSILAGALFICRSEYIPYEGTDLASITNEDWDNILSHIKVAVNTKKSIGSLNGNDCYPVLVLDGDGYC